MALGIGPGDEIITTAFSFAATAEAVLLLGARPVYVDIDPVTFNIDANLIEEKINARTRAILPVGLYGQCPDFPVMRLVARQHGLALIEDAAQSFGATQDGMRSGSLGTIGATSFFPAKPLGAYGDAGIITTNNLNFYNKLKKLRNLGSDKKFIHDEVGLNSRLDTIQAIILNEKLKNLTSYNKKRQKIAKFYNQNINNKKISKLKYSKSSVYHQYVVLVDNRNSLIKLLKKNKIQYGFHYPYAIHQLNVFKKRFKNKRYKNAEILAKNSISLPIDPNLSKKELNFIVKTLNEF